jgi:hypothetical protein
VFTTLTRAEDLPPEQNTAGGSASAVPRQLGNHLYYFLLSSERYPSCLEVPMTYDPFLWLKFES